MKTQWDEGSGRILLGNNTGNGAVMLRPFSFQCAEFVFQLEHKFSTLTIDLNRIFRYSTTA
jgi:hypothetical protein